MKVTKRIHLSYILGFLAILSMGAGFTATRILEIGPSATVTGPVPEIRFLDTGTTSVDFDWEVEATNGHFEISPDGTTNGFGMFKIHGDAPQDRLTLDANGNAAFNGEEAQSFNEVEIFGSSGASDSFAALAISPGGIGSPTDSTSARMAVNTITNKLNFNVRSAGATGYTAPMILDMKTPNNTLTMNSSGNVGVGGISPDNIISDLHVSGGRVTLDPAGTAGDWQLVPGGGGMWFGNRDGSTTYPFKLANNVDSDALVVSNFGAGDIGMGTSMPEASLHVKRTDGTGKILVQNDDSVTERKTLLELCNNGAPQMLYTNCKTNVSWELNPNPNDNFIINSIGLGSGQEFTLDKNNGNCRVSGQMRADEFILNSNRDLKAGFDKVDGQDVLQKVIDMAVTRWHYKETKDVDHIGPMAQDFHAAFGLGSTDEAISVVDLGGITMAAIQGLNEQLEDQVASKDKEIATLKTENQQLNDRLSRLEEMVNKLAETQISAE